MEKIKTIEVSITSLKITSEDDWLDKHIKERGDSVLDSPQYKYLMGYPMKLVRWMAHRKLGAAYMAVPLMETLNSIIKYGQLEPIKIYKDMRINTGHKRAACLAFLGEKGIKAVVVPDDFKL